MAPIDPMTDFPKVRSKFATTSEQVPIARDRNNPVNPMTFYAREKGTEEKVYIILYQLNEEEDTNLNGKTYEVCIGRTAAYSDIKNKLISGLDIDVHRSVVITETLQTETKTGNTKYYLVPYDECITVYSFCVSVKTFFDTDDFDIEDYSDGDVPEFDPMENTTGFLSQEQIEYRRMLEESLKRGQFIKDMRENLHKGEQPNIDNLV